MSWKSSKQSLIAPSTMELEFIALDLARYEVNWLRIFLIEIPLGIKPTFSISMNCDCQAAISIAKNKSFNGKNRHIWLRHDVVKLRNGVISINYVKSEINLVDPLAKPLGRKMILETLRGMRLR